MISYIKCKLKGHESRKAACPFTNNIYDICDKCGRRLVVGRASDQYLFDEKNNTWRTK